MVERQGQRLGAACRAAERRLRHRRRADDGERRLRARRHARRAAAIAGDADRGGGSEAGSGAHPLSVQQRDLTSGRWRKRSRRRRPTASPTSSSATCSSRTSAPIASRSSRSPASTPVFPLWLRPTDALAREMIAGGLQAHLATVDLKKLHAGFRRPPLRRVAARRSARGHRSLRRERRIPLVRVCRADAGAADLGARRRDGGARRVCLCGFAGGVEVLVVAGLVPATSLRKARVLD